MISGSYWPGDISVFFRNADGTFAAGEFLKDPDGKNANGGPPWKSAKKPEMDSLAAAPWLVDWDDDGDLDLLIGNIAGHVVLLTNEGGPKTPQFVRKGPLEAGGEVLDVDSNDAGPTTADWDGDGRWDLVVGGGAGTVKWFRNEGTKGAPKLAKGVELVKGNGHGPAKNGATGPAMRVKPHVVDWNGDGALDLLLGDYTSSKGPEPELTAEQRATRTKLEAEQREVSTEMGRLFEKCDNDTDQLQGEDKKAWEKVQKRSSELWEALRPLQAEHKPAGHVWVLLRKPASAAVEGSARKG